METYQVVALAVMVAMGYVVHSTMALNGLRKRLGVPKRMLNFRDLEVIRHPERFDPQEVRMVRVNWAACAALFALVLALIWVIPEDLAQRLTPTRHSL